MAAANRQFERRFEDMATSFSEHVDTLEEMISNAMKDVIYWKNMFVDLDTKFKEYVTKSERYIKEKDIKLAEVQEECQQMSYKYQNHGEIYKQEKTRADNFEKLYNDLKAPFDELKKEAHRLKLALVKYEQKYQFMDLGKLHEQVQ